jgi:hypothetical protein
MSIPDGEMKKEKCSAPMFSPLKNVHVERDIYKELISAKAFICLNKRYDNLII